MKIAVQNKLIPLFLLIAALNGLSQAKIDSLVSVYDEIPGENEKEVSQLNDISRQYARAYPGISEQFALKALKSSQELGLTIAQANAYLNLASLYRTRSDITKSLEYGFNALNLFESLKDSNRMAIAANTIGRSYGDIANWEKASEFYWRSLAMNKTDLKTRGNAFNNIGSMYHDQDNYDSAYFYFEKALELGLEIKDVSGLAIVYNNLGIIQLQKFNNIPKAVEYYNQSIEMKEQMADFFGLAYSYINMGNLYRNNGKYEEARGYYRTAVAYTDSAEAKGVKSAAYSRWARSEGLAGNEALKNEYLEISRRLNVEVLRERQESEIKQLEAAYNLEKRDRELLISNQNLQLLEQDKKLGILQIAFLSAGMIFLVIFYFLQKTKNQKAREAQEARNEVLKLELGHKTNELDSFTLNFIQKQDMMNELQQGIKSINLKELPEATKKKISELSQVISRQARNDKEWEDFRSYFDKVHKDFFIKLKTSYPDLGISELRLAALIKLQLSIKESSSILGISPNSVKTARYRLRTKLGLDREQNLTSFLMMFENS